MALEDVDTYSLASFSLTCVGLAILVLACLPLAVLSWRPSALGRSDIVRSALHVNAVWTALVYFALYIADVAVASSFSDDVSNTYPIIYVFEVILSLASELCILGLVMHIALDHGSSERRHTILAVLLYGILALLAALAIVLIGLEGRIIDLIIHPVFYDDSDYGYYSEYSDASIDSAYTGINVAFFALYLVAIFAVAACYALKRGSSTATSTILFVGALALLFLVIVFSLAQSALFVSSYFVDAGASALAYAELITGLENFFQALLLVLLGVEAAQSTTGGGRDARREKPSAPGNENQPA